MNKPVKCDICDQQCHSTYVDGKTKQGPWATMCPKCHLAWGVGIGTGKGQRYSAISREKIAG